MDNRPIGIFDSGLGGLTSVSAMIKHMPNENIIYFGDTGRVPYGTRSNDTITRYAIQDIEFLQKFDVKAIIIACGTVSSVALEKISIDIPLIGVVNPATNMAKKITKNGKIGVIGTEATIRSNAYQKNLADMCVLAKACPLFVPFVENGRFKRGDALIQKLVEEYLSDFKNKGIDTLILGCTHYPLLADIIKDYLGDEISLINPGETAVLYAKNIIKHCDENYKKIANIKYYVSDSAENFSKNGSVFLDRAIENVELIDIF